MRAMSCATPGWGTSCVPMTPDRGEVTDDAILGGRMRLFQPRRGHRFGHDAILLAAATPARAGDRVAELGAGVGAASLALLARSPDADVTLVEIDPALTALAMENISRNGLQNRARAVTLDAASPAQAFENAGLRAGSFDQVLMNPPFNDPSLQASPDPARRTAHMAADNTLRTWLDAAEVLLRPAGGVSLIWRANGEDLVLRELAKGFGAAAIRPVHSAPAQPAIRILVHAVKGAPAALRRLPGLILADQDRCPSAEAEAILRGGMSLSMTD